MSPEIKKILFSILFLPVLSFPLRAQNINMEETLEYLNRKLQPVCGVTVDRGILVARYYDRGVLVREDQLFCKSIDLNTMRYDSENRLFIINCSNKAKCVDRQLIIRKIQRDYQRISFPVTLDTKGAEGMRRAFTHMIKLVLDTKYQNDEPFEK